MIQLQRTGKFHTVSPSGNPKTIAHNILGSGLPRRFAPGNDVEKQVELKKDIVPTGACLKKWLIPNKLVGLKKDIVGNSARDFFARQTAEPKEYFVYFEALVCSIGEKDPLKGNEGFQKFHLKKKGAGRIAIRPAQTPI